MNQTNKLLRALLFLMAFSAVAGFPSVLASDEEKKAPEKKEAKESSEGKEGKEGKEKSEKKGDGKSASEKSTERKSWEAQAKPPTHPRFSTSASDTGSNDGSGGRRVLTQATGCLVDYAALEDLKRTKDELEERKKDIAAKEADLKTRELAIGDELRNLERIRDEIAKNNDQKAKEKEARVAKLVETFLTMSPKSAAKVLADLEDSLAVLSMSQMDTPHLAKIMNNMDPLRSSHLSELLAGIKKNKEALLTKKGAS